MYLRKVILLRDEIASKGEYPFSIPALANFDQIEFSNKVTFFVGENGTGKSTLLEGIADKCDFNLAGGGRNNTYNVHESDSILGKHLRLSWLPKITNGFFLRAESFYHFATHIDELGREDPRAYGRYGGKSLHHQSHGESFFSLFINRFNGKAIYLLDEPEAALSPQRQLSLLRIIHDLTTDGESQFIIATHSPILLGFPDATILSFNGEGISQIEYEMTDHYQITSYFLKNRERFLRDIFAD